MGRGSWVALVVVVCACSDGGGGDPDPALARSQILIDDLSFAAWFYDRDWPDREPLADGTCRLLPRDAGDPIDSPDLIGVGTLTLEGTALGTVEIPRNDFGTYERREQGPILGDASHVDVSAAGSAEVEAFEIGADVPAPLELDGAQEEGWPVLVDGEALEITWTGADEDSRVALFLSDAIASAIVSCQGPDTGSLVVPADLVTDFLAVATWEESPDIQVSSAISRARRSAIELDDGHTISLSVSRSASLAPAPQ